MRQQAVSDSIVTGKIRAVSIVAMDGLLPATGSHTICFPPFPIAYNELLVSHISFPRFLRLLSCLVSFPCHRLPVHCLTVHGPAAGGTTTRTIQNALCATSARAIAIFVRATEVF